QRSDFEAMLNYYKRNYPRPPYEVPAGWSAKVKAPVLMIHGLNDRALLPGAPNGTWEWLETDLTLVTVPGAGHFVQQDASAVVTRGGRRAARWEGCAGGGRSVAGRAEVAVGGEGGSAGAVGVTSEARAGWGALWAPTSGGGSTACRVATARMRPQRCARITG